MIMVGSGGGGIEDWGALDAAAAAVIFLCDRSRVVRVSWICDTRVKGVIWGRWRWASFMV